jgi:hypothetical protein
MKITEVSYSMLRVTKQFENDRVEVSIQLEDGDSPALSIEKARQLCDESLAAGREASLRDKLKEKMSTVEGRTSLERFLACGK